MIIPNNQLLIDDSPNNIIGWIKNNGRGYIFDSKISKNTKGKVKSLDFFIRR